MSEPWSINRGGLSLGLAGEDGSPAGFLELCVREDGTCLALEPTASLLGLAFNFSADRVPTSDAAVLAVMNAIDLTWPLEQALADPTRGADGLVESSRAMLLRYGLLEDALTEADNEFQLAFDHVATGVASVADPTILRVTHWSKAGLDSESSRSVSKDITLFVVALNIVVLFLGFNLGRNRSILGRLPFPDLVRGRYLLANMSICTVGLAVIAGFGIASACGATFHSVIATMPLIALGVQVDDCIITVNTLSRYRRGSLEDRFATSLRESGPCITATSFTSVTAFAIGISAALPGVSFFCMFATAVFFFGWIFQLTFFYACTVLDERRIARSSDCLTGLCKASSAIADDADADADAEIPKLSGLQRMLSAYADVILHPLGALVVALLFFGAVGAAAALDANITVGLPLQDILPDDSYILSAFETETQLFKGRLTPVTIVVRDEDFNSPAARAHFADAVAASRNLSFAVSVAPNWMDAYDAWQGSSYPGGYLDNFASFLAVPGHGAWQYHARCVDARCTSLATAKFEVLAHMAQPGKPVMDELLVREAIEAAVSPFFPPEATVISATPFMFAETDAETWTGVLRTCAFALVGIYCLCWSNMSITTSALITLSVAMVDADLIFVAYAWGVRLNSISYVCIVMACGLAVDYCVHVGHAFEHAMKEGAVSTRAAAKQAVVTMGTSVFQGALTTLLGVLVLAFSSSVAFRTLFRFVFTTVLLGSAHGIAFIPVVLAYLSPPCLLPRPRVGASSAITKEQAATPASVEQTAHSIQVPKTPSTV